MKDSEILFFSVSFLLNYIFIPEGEAETNIIVL